MNNKKVLLFVMLATMCTAMFSISASATQIDAVSTPTEYSISSDITVFSKDVIVIKYRLTPEGKVQYRHWNETKGVWVEPNWITLP